MRLLDLLFLAAGKPDKRGSSAGDGARDGLTGSLKTLARLFQLVAVVLDCLAELIKVALRCLGFATDAFEIVGITLKLVFANGDLSLKARVLRFLALGQRRAAALLLVERRKRGLVGIELRFRLAVGAIEKLFLFHEQIGVAGVEFQGTVDVLQRALRVLRRALHALQRALQLGRIAAELDRQTFVRDSHGFTSFRLSMKEMSAQNSAPAKVRWSFTLTGQPRRPLRLAAPARHPRHTPRHR